MSEAKSRVRLCAVDDIETGAMLQVSSPGLPALAVYRVKDEEFTARRICARTAAHP